MEMKKKQKHYSGKELLYHRAAERQKKQKQERKGISPMSWQSQLERLNILKEPVERAKHWQKKGAKNGNTNICYKMHNSNNNNSGQYGTVCDSESVIQMCRDAERNGIKEKE